ncbi:MAG TPA: PTS glucose transporter subunit IIA [Symbiobacteriaceae bacterium]|nr:PTS glucose transporter subunit IIA [Symbiobacteriaceae bacterium]
MVFGLFKKKSQVTEVVAPLTGEVVDISQVPDPVFAEKMMGDGFAINPSEGKVLAPVSGELINLFPTMHALGIRTAEGLEVLVHVGIDTVKLGGEGFKALVQQGARVEAGQPLLEFDLEAIRAKVPSLITPVVFTNLEDRTWSLTKKGPAKAGDAVATVTG